MDYRFTNENGVTFISTLFALFIIVMTLPLLSFIFNKLTEPKLYDDINYTQFFNFLSYDILLAKNVEVKGNTIIFEVLSGEKATLSHYKDIIRRQVSGVGYEVYVRDVSDFKVTKKSGYLLVEIKSKKGETYEKKVPIL